MVQNFSIAAFESTIAQALGESLPIQTALRWEKTLLLYYPCPLSSHILRQSKAIAQNQQQMPFFRPRNRTSSQWTDSLPFCLKRCDCWHAACSMPEAAESQTPCWALKDSLYASFLWGRCDLAQQRKRGLAQIEILSKAL